jgi:hypothetical protein
MNFGNTIKKENQASLQDCATAMIFLRYHLHDELKKKGVPYSKRSIERYEHQKTVILPKSYYGWMHPKLHSLKSAHN